MALQGTLQDFGLADIFQLIGMQRKTGILTLRRGAEVVNVSLLNGQVVYADTNRRRLEERIGALLVKSGKITERQLGEALRAQKQTLQRLGVILLSQQVISPQDLGSVLQLQVTQLVFDLFRWRDGEYHFSQEESVDYDKELFTPVPADTILMEGARMMDEWPIIERRIPSFDIVFRRSGAALSLEPAGGTSVYDSDTDFRPEAESARESLDLGSEERRVLLLVDGKSSVQEIIDGSELGEFETCRVLYDLLTRGLLEAKGEPVAASTVAAPSGGLSRPLAAGILAGALMLASVALLPWSPATPVRPGGVLDAEALFTPASLSRLARLDLALRVHYLDRQDYPRSLAALVEAGLVGPGDLVDPKGRPYSYRIDSGGYELAGPGHDGAPDPELVLTGVFLPGQRLVIEGAGVPGAGGR